ncbi:Ig-like domain-containing protein [Saccharicrinis aurantiacus]|uniref:Ig-like domain-containing protein n=1 Tax=Saccharicrinis aurantiacus TaxID=1849719 RepID=UPI00248F610B|nr:Ig-like domain-containing protein [Saccharicrinis aurantiacus]
MHNTKYSFIPAIVALIIIAYSCANPGFPTGGPKDETPPVVKKSTPELNALNYRKKTINIEFDEIIKLDDVFNKFVTSPPLKKRPAIDARGAKLRIKLDEEEEFQENTTYTFDFGNAIQDNNEGNPIPSFVFSFSTGEVVDSFAIMGNLWDAEDLSPMEGILILAHKNLNDTAFTNSVPERLAKTDEEGFFALKNLSPGEYRLYALGDANNNYMFDQPAEQIAWFDSIVSPSMEYVEFADTIYEDSIYYYDQLVYSPNDVRMFLFTEDNGNQYMLGNERKTKNTMSFFFNNPAEEFKITPIDTVVGPDWAIYEPSVNNDTVLVWVADSNLYKKDTLKVELNYMALDTLFNPALMRDTLTMFHFEFVKKERKRKRDKDQVEKKEMLKVQKSSSQVDVYSNYAFIMPTPIANIDREKLYLYQQIDTITEQLDFELEQDAFFKRKYWVKTRWTPGGQYSFGIDSLAITDIYGLHTDSIGSQFSVKKLDSYGLFLLDIANSEENWLIQLLDASGNILQQKYVPASGKLAFQYIKPSSYIIKLVIDENMNGQWDPGDYSEKRQPEKVYYYAEPVNVRANWDVEISWDPYEFDIYEFVKNNRKAKKRE